MLTEFEKYLTEIEELSIDISNLVFKNEFEKIPELDKKRLNLIKKIKVEHKEHFNKKVKDLIEVNGLIVKEIEKKLKLVCRESDKFSKRFNAYKSSI